MTTSILVDDKLTYVTNKLTTNKSLHASSIQINQQATKEQRVSSIYIQQKI